MLITRYCPKCKHTTKHETKDVVFKESGTIIMSFRCQTCKRRVAKNRKARR